MNFRMFTSITGFIQFPFDEHSAFRLSFFSAFNFEISYVPQNSRDSREHFQSCVNLDNFVSFEVIEAA